MGTLPNYKQTLVCVRVEVLGRHDVINKRSPLEGIFCRQIENNVVGCTGRCCSKICTLDMRKVQKKPGLNLDAERIRWGTGGSTTVHKRVCPYMMRFCAVVTNKRSHLEIGIFYRQIEGCNAGSCCSEICTLDMRKVLQRLD